MITLSADEGKIKQTKNRILLDGVLNTIKFGDEEISIDLNKKIHLPEDMPYKIINDFPKLKDKIHVLYY